MADMTSRQGHGFFGNCLRAAGQIGSVDTVIAPTGGAGITELTGAQFPMTETPEAAIGRAAAITPDSTPPFIAPFTSRFCVALTT